MALGGRSEWSGMQGSSDAAGPTGRTVRAPSGGAGRWYRVILLAVIAAQIMVPTVMLLLRLTGDGTALRFGWQMFSGVP